MYSKVHIGKHLPDNFPIQNGLKRDALSPLLFKFAFWVTSEYFMVRLRLIEMCLNKMYSKVHVGKHLPDNFSIQNGLKRDALSPLLFNFAFWVTSEHFMVRLCLNVILSVDNASKYVYIYIFCICFEDFIVSLCLNVT
jgi:hypothetical protein